MVTAGIDAVVVWWGEIKSGVTECERVFDSPFRQEISVCLYHRLHRFIASICVICGLRRLFADDVPGFLVFPQTLKRGMPNHAFVGPLRERDFADTLRFGPDRASQVGIFWNLFEGPFVDHEPV